MRMKWGSPFFVFLVLHFLLGAVGISYAMPITYFFGGEGRGSIGSDNFNKTEFLIKIHSNTDSVMEEVEGFSSIPSLSSAVRIGNLGEASFLSDDLQVYSFSAFNAVGIRSFSTGLDLSYTLNEGYDLTSNLDLVNGYLGGLFFKGVSTDIGELTFKEVYNLNFYAALTLKEIDDSDKVVKDDGIIKDIGVIDKTSPVPEPGTLLLLSAGVLGFAAGRRKLSRKF